MPWILAVFYVSLSKIMGLLIVRLAYSSKRIQKTVFCYRGDTQKCSSPKLSIFLSIFLEKPLILFTFTSWVYSLIQNPQIRYSIVTRHHFRDQKAYLPKTRCFFQMNKSFIYVGTCPLHIVHNSFQKDITTFDFNFDEFSYNIHVFFSN